MTRTLFLLGLSACAHDEGTTSDRDKDRENAPVIVLPAADGTSIPGTAPEDCPGGAPTLVDGWPAYWTVIFYGAGNNDLQQDIIDDINEAELGHQGSANVHFLAQMDYEWPLGAERFRITPDDDPNAINSEIVGWTSEEPNSSDYRVLASFGEWAATCYPADNYTVIVSGHGSGWSRASEAEGAEGASIRHARRVANTRGEALRGLAQDDSSYDVMTIDELRDGLRHIRDATVRDGDRPELNRLVLYGSDACLMQTVEVAHELRNEVRYVIGSEETEPGSGWPYSTIMRELTNRPEYYWESPHELVEMIVTKYGKSYSPSGGADHIDETTLSAVDVRNMIKVRNRVASVAQSIFWLLNADVSHGNSGYTLTEHIIASRQGAYLFKNTYTDMGLLFENLRNAIVEDGLAPEIGETWNHDHKWRELREALDALIREPDELTGADRGLLNDAIVRTAAGPAYPGARGVSIYFPESECGWGMTPADYARSEFGSGTGWGDVVEQIFLRDLPENHTIGNGVGTMEITPEGGESFSVDVACERKGTVLHVDDTEQYGNYSVGLSLDGDQWRVTEVSLQGEIKGTASQAEGMLPDETQALAGNLSAVVDGGAASTAVDISISCEQFEYLRCGEQ